MKRFIIRRKADGAFLRRVASYGNKKTVRWVKSADDCTLITTSSAATCIMNGMKHDPAWPKVERGRIPKYYSRTYRQDFPFEVIDVEIILYRAGTQPFIDGTLK